LLAHPRLLICETRRLPDIQVYTGKGWREGADEPFVGAMSSVYHRTDTGWRLALYQQTQVIGRYPGPPKLSW